MGELETGSSGSRSVSTSESTTTAVPEATLAPEPTPGLSLLSNLGAPHRQLARREVGQGGLSRPVRLINHDEFADGSTSAQVMRDGVAGSAGLDAPTGDSTSAQVVPDGDPDLPLLDLGIWLALGLALLLLPLFFLARRRRKKKQVSQPSYPW